MAIQADIQTTSLGTRVELFQLDLNPLGVAEILYFHNGVNELGLDVVFAGITYNRLPCEATGFAKVSNGAQPRPTLSVANIDGLVGAFARENNDLVHAKLTRKRTLLKYLDAVNFVGGTNPTADPFATFDDDVWIVNRKLGSNDISIQWELVSALDLEGVQLPRRQCIQNVCAWKYRSAECGYTGGAVANAQDVPTSDINQDSCGKRLTSCKLRFGESPLPYGGFPSVTLVGN